MGRGRPKWCFGSTRDRGEGDLALTRGPRRRPRSEQSHQAAKARLGAAGWWKAQKNDRSLNGSRRLEHAHFVYGCIGNEESLHRVRVGAIRRPVERRQPLRSGAAGGGLSGDGLGLRVTVTLVRVLSGGGLGGVVGGRGCESTSRKRAAGTGHNGLRVEEPKRASVVRCGRCGARGGYCIP